MALIEIKKSKFYGFAFKVFNTSEIEEKLKILKKEHKKATHICYAYILSSPHQEHFFDDKEPNGTAGRPILNVIQKQNKSDVVVFVIRYFGGIKLGSGGLIRAYTKITAETLNEIN